VSKFWSVSDPKSETYTSYPTLDSLYALTHAPQSTLTAFKSWIQSDSNSECTVDRIVASGDIVTVKCSIAGAESLLDTEFYAHQHISTHEIVHRAHRQLSIPDHLIDSIAFIGGANTPIHDYASHRPVPVTIPHDHTHLQSMLQQLQSKQSQYSQQSSASLQPSVVRAAGGPGEIAVFFTVICQNGQPNTDVAPAVPCSSHAPSVASVQVAVHGPSLPAPTVYTVAVSDITCVDKKTTVVCGTNAGIAGTLQNDVAHTVTVAVTYASGTPPSSPYSNSSAVVFPKDFATPAFLAELYNIPQGVQVRTAEGGTNAVAEFLEQYFNPADLETWFTMFGLEYSPPAQVVGPNFPNIGSFNGTEAQLDIQFLAGMAVNASTWFWSTAGRNPYSRENEPFLEWLTGVADRADAPKVWSISYGDVESTIPKDYADRVNAEFQKMGLRGMSLMFSSADDGVASYLGRNLTMNAHYCSKANPEFPASSPYVTAVGATQMSRTYAPACALKSSRNANICGKSREVACSAATDGVITVGAGFSNYYETPTYQKDFVEAYLTADVNLPPEEFYNASGRAFPDLSLFGTAFPVLMGPEFISVAGTSASTPLFAALVTLWNDLRAQMGQKTLGFLNPWLYQLRRDHPSAYTDIIYGDNRCLVSGIPCCKYGFYATVGFDMPTGLGAPNWQVIANTLVNPTNKFPYAEGSGSTVVMPSSDSNNSASAYDWIAIVLSIIAIVAAAYTLYKFKPGNSRGSQLLIDE
jgi:tripeptidyl-peptidase I